MLKLLFVFVISVIGLFSIPPEILNQFLTWVMPLVIYLVTKAVTYLKPILPGWVVLIIVLLLGGLATLLTQLLASPELVWWQQILFNLLAIVISQFRIQFGGEKRAEDKKIVADDKRLNG